MLSHPTIDDGSSAFNDLSIMIQLFRVFFAISLAFFVFSCPVQAANLDLGKTVFEAQCSGCHENGGNIIRRGKTLKQAALKRNGYDSFDAVVGLVTNGKSNMSAYRDRLSPDEIQSVSRYVLARASADWKPAS
jgi:cytochrome c6